MSLASSEQQVYSVSQLNATVKDLLEHNLPPIWVEGEISNFAIPRSGHWYFTLKDHNAQVRCTMWRGRNQLVGFTPRDGEQVLVRARVGLYEPRGEYQMTVDRLQPAGLGALQRSFDQLKAQLQKEGLFDDARKQPLPALPRCIGLITSPTGAALQDMLTTLARRFPIGQVILYPVPVQGKEAAPAIVCALATAARREECDVLIVARGGGSLEDLWPFNEESVARAIAACPIPVVSGVGHETDFTIADFVADLRAPTPTGAAERVAPDLIDWHRAFAQYQQRMQRDIARRIADAAQQLSSVERRLTLQHPSRRLLQWSQRLDELDLRAQQALGRAARTGQQRVQTLAAQLRGHHPERKLQLMHQRLAALRQRLPLLSESILQRVQRRTLLAARSLDVLSPLKTLERGYAIALFDQQPLTRARDVAPGSPLQVRLHEGQLHCTVTAIDSP